MADKTRRPEMPEPGDRPDTGGAGPRADKPQAYVRLRPGAGGSYEAEVRVSADPEAGTAAEAEGFTAVPLPEMAGTEYPKFVFHADGRRQIVYSKDEQDALEGFEETPPAPKDEDVYQGAVPAPVAGAAMTASPHRPPVPADRG